MRLTLLAVVSLALPASAAVHYVDAVATGANTGSSWTDAFVDLQSALAVAGRGDDIWVAEGTYLPGPTAAATDSFFLKNGVRLYGGFAGGETSLAQRDWIAHPTVLSGDVGQDDVYGTPWYAGWNINTSNSAHVVTASGTDASAVLDGFVVRAGHTGPAGTPAGSGEMFGGGIYIVGGSPTILNCTLERNLAAFGSGAAIYALDSSPTVRGCTLRENWVHLGSGAGLLAYGDSTPVIEDCDFSWNFAVTGSGGMEAQGAAIATFYTPPITISRCTFEHNSAQQFFSAGGIEIARGGAISSFADGLTVRECVFRANRANAGGAIQVWGRATIVNSLFVENQAYAVPIGGISTGGWGSAISSRPGPGDLVRVVGCTLVANQAGEAAVFGLGNIDTVVADSILWANTATGQGVGLRGAQYKGSIALSHTCVEGLFAPNPNDPPPSPGDVPGCIEDDPQFVSLAGLDLHLATGSPCIDTGDNAALPGAAALDLDGLQRIALGASSFTVDMGAYEHGSQLPGPCPAILVDPAAQTIVVGAYASLDVLATGDELAFQWRKDGVPLANGGAVSGAHTPTLTIGPASLSDAGSYDVLVSNTCGSLTSAAAILGVDPPPLGTVFCSGDGDGTPCPCGNEKEDGMGCENSTGEGAALSAVGSTSVAADDAVLSTHNIPPNTIGIDFMGTTQVQGGKGTPFGDGLLCVNPTLRFPASSSGPGGVLVLGSPVSKSKGKIQPGLTIHFQTWLRDPNGPCGNKSNTSNGLSIDFTP